MWPFNRKFPYTNFHELNLDWILGKLKRAVFSVNGISPDDSGNVEVPKITGVSSVNGKFPAATTGNVELNAQDVDALPADYEPPVLSVNGETGEVLITPPVVSVNGQEGAVMLTAADIQGSVSESNMRGQIYVSANRGSDIQTPDRGSYENPYRSISTAINYVKNRGTFSTLPVEIIIEPGVYPSALRSYNLPSIMFRIDTGVVINGYVFLQSFGDITFHSYTSGDLQLLCDVVPPENSPAFQIEARSCIISVPINIVVTTTEVVVGFRIIRTWPFIVQYPSTLTVVSTSTYAGHIEDSTFICNRPHNLNPQKLSSYHSLINMTSPPTIDGTYTPF